MPDQHSRQELIHRIVELEEQNKDLQAEAIKYRTLFDSFTHGITVSDFDKKLKGALESMTDAVFISDADGKLVDFNEAFSTFHRFENRNECLRVLADWPSLLDVYSEDGKLLTLDMLVVSRALRGEQHNNEIYKLQRRDTGETWFGSYNFAPIYNNEGDITGSVVVARDITEQKKAEKAQLQEKHFFDKLMSSLPGIFYLYDSNLKLKRWNQNHEKLLGYSSEEMNGRYLGDWHARREERDLAVMASKRIIKQGLQFDSVESDLLHKNGKEIPFLMTGVRIQSPDGPMMAGIGIDLTERRSLEEQLRQSQKMESVGQLAGGVAHDFNNMLTAILGHTQIAMISCSPSESTLSHLKRVQEAALRSADLVKQLLAFARKENIAPKVLDINDMSVSMLSMIRRVIGEDINLSWLPGSDLWKIRMDPSQVDQLLVNLCVNARDAINDVGKISIETKNITFDLASCRVKKYLIPGDYVMLAVSDSGSGMSKDTQEHIFEPFFTTKGIGEGTGLGLATVYGVVKQNNGFVNLYSEIGKGTTFRIYLPRFHGEAIAQQTSVTEETPKGQGEVVLLVEDEAAIREVAQTLLSELGYVVLSAGTPLEALKLAKNNTAKLQLLITDVIMPEMNGRELEKTIRKIKPDVKCLFASGYTADIIDHHGVLDDNVCFLPKPFSMDELAFKVREALEEKHD